MTEVVVTFWGLCSLIDRADTYEVYLPNGRMASASGVAHHGHGPSERSTDARHDQGGNSGHAGAEGHAMPHVATMAISADGLANVHDPDAWTPTAIVHHGQVQLACWDLAGQVVTFTPAPPPALAGPSWPEDDRRKSIPLHAYHPDNPAKSQDDLTGPPLEYALMILRTGRIQSGAGQPLLVSQGTAQPKAQTVARSIDWFPGGETLAIEAGGRRVVVKAGTAISVTNVSVQPSSGHEHFGLYYTLLTKTVPPTERVMVAPASSPGIRTEEAYDCVPPTTGS